MQTIHPEKAGFSSERLKRIDAVMQRYVERGELAGLITTVARRGETVHLEKFGLMDIEARKPMQFDTIFRIASMTKPITSVAVMLLYEEGHLHLNTPVSKFIPAFKDVEVLVKETQAGLDLAPVEREITFRHLFTHTAGLGYGIRAVDTLDRLYQEARQKLLHSESPVTLGQVVQAILRLPLAFQPGTKWRYSFAIDVLGYLVEVISGMPFEAFIAERIFQPLGMVDTAFFVPEVKAERLAAVYQYSEEAHKLARLDLAVPSQPPTWVSPGGGLVSTVHDYARFAQMLVNGGELDGVRLLSPTTVGLMEMNHAPAAALPYGFQENDLYHAGYGYGLGMRVLMDVSQSGLAGSVGEFGWDGAFSTYFWIDRKEALYGLLLVQHQPNAYYPIAQQFKALTYQALVE